jgi:hypothetical protein
MVNGCVDSLSFFGVVAYAKNKEIANGLESEIVPFLLEGG